MECGEFSIARRIGIREYPLPICVHSWLYTGTFHVERALGREHWGYIHVGNSQFVLMKQ